MSDEQEKQQPTSTCTKCGSEVPTLSPQSLNRLQAQLDFSFRYDTRLYNAINDALGVIDELTEAHNAVCAENARLKERLSPKPELPKPKKTCPWCGLMGYLQKKTRDGSTPLYNVYCPLGSCETRPLTRWYETPEEAIGAWDTRAGEE